MVTQEDLSSAKPLIKLIDEYKKTIRSKGPILEWPDPFLERVRDKYRDAARRYRGCWSIEFYETLQNINKESIKRGHCD